MNVRRLFLLLGVLAMLAVTGCTRLVPWTPMTDGAALAEDHVVRYEGVVIQVHKFGVYDHDSMPTAEVRTHNGSRKPVAFGIDGFKLDIGGKLVPPVLDQEGEFPSIYLEPGESYNTRLSFPPLDLATTADGRTLDRPSVLHLHLAPLVIDGVDHELPVLTFGAPDS